MTEPSVAFDLSGRVAMIVGASSLMGATASGSMRWHLASSRAA
jgi:hypothetical protein